MPLSKIHDMLSELKNTKSSNQKIQLIKKFSNNHPSFDTIIKMALSHDKIYHVKSLGNYRQRQGGSFSEIIDYLSWMTNQTGIKKVEKRKLNHLASANEKTFFVVECIIKKDLRCGCGAKLVNKALPGIVTTIPYMRCMTEKAGLKRIKYNDGAFCQKKADGGFAYGMISRKTKRPVLLTRNGKEIHLHGYFNDDLELLRETDDVITMELVAIDDNGKEYPRQYGNGLITKAVRGTITPLEASQIRGQAWDLVPQQKFWEGYYSAPYRNRWNLLTKVLYNMGRIKRILSNEVHSEIQAKEFYVQMRKKGHEGAVLKNTFGPWKDHTSPNQCKLKPKFQAEFRITGWYKGGAGKKYENCLGGLNFKTDDGKVVCNTGSGFTDNDRGFISLDNGSIETDHYKLGDWDDNVGSIVTVEFDSLIQDKNHPDVYSLFLPIFVEVREDKNETDDLEYLKGL